MGTFSLMHWIVVPAVILIVFGAGKLPNVMGDLAKGIKTFKQGMREDETPPQVEKAGSQHPPGRA